MQQANQVGLLLKTDSCPSGLTQTLSAEFIAEALTISDLFELNEVASVELLLAGDQLTPHVVYCTSSTFSNTGFAFYPRDAMLARVIVIATCLSVRLSRAGIVSKRRKLAA